MAQMRVPSPGSNIQLRSQRMRHRPWPVLSPCTTMNAADSLARPRSSEQAQDGIDSSARRHTGPESPRRWPPAVARDWRVRAPSVARRPQTTQRCRSAEPSSAGLRLTCATAPSICRSRRRAVTRRPAASLSVDPPATTHAKPTTDRVFGHCPHDPRGQVAAVLEKFQQ